MTNRNRILVVDIDDTILSTRRRKYEVLTDLGVELPYEEAVRRSVERREFGDIDYTRFFELFDSDKYLGLDEPLPEAAEVLSEMAARNLVLAYVTNRHEGEGSLREVTLESLRKHNFPLPDDQSVYLFTKPKKGTDRKATKLAVVHTLSRIFFPFIGVGDLPEDGEIYLACGFVPIIVRRPDKVLDYPQGSIVVDNWSDVRREIQDRL